MSRTCWVPDGLAGERVDTGLARLLGLTRSQAAQLAQAGRVEQDGVVVGKSERLTAGALLQAELPDPPPDFDAAADAVTPLEVLWRDEHVLVVDKPAGMAAHPSVGWVGPSVSGVLTRRGIALASEGPAGRAGIVHRLDVGTSGVMAVAASNQAYRGLKRAFKKRLVSKTYHALAQGGLEPPRGTIDAPIGRHPGAGFRFAVTAVGKHAVTHYTVIESLRGACLAEVDLETGRTHQIRVHFAAIGHPLIGDLMYGANPRQAESLALDRQWLHATALAFDHPVSGQPIEVTSPYPPELTAALSQLRQELK